MSLLSKVTFNPREQVLFEATSFKQQAPLSIQNDHDFAITYKMKSTRPGLYKMRPVYGIVPSGDKADIKLIFKGLKGGQKPPPNDRFTVVIASAPEMTQNVAKLWKNHKYHSQMAENSDVSKKYIPVRYLGYSDQNDEEDIDMQLRACRLNSSMDIVDDLDFYIEERKQLPVIVMYRLYPINSEDEDDDEEDVSQKF